MVTNWRGNTANRCPRPDSGHRGNLRQHLAPGAVETPPTYDDPDVQHQERPTPVTYTHRPLPTNAYV